MATPYDFAPLPADVGNDAGAQGMAAAMGPAALAPAGPLPPQAPAAPAFSPAAIDALFQAGKLTPEQYASMGGKLMPNASAPVSPELRAASAAAPAPPNGMSSTPVTPATPKGGLVFHPGGGMGVTEGQGMGGLVLPQGGGQQVPAAWVPQGRQTHTEQGIQFSPETQAAMQGATAAAGEVDKAAAARAEAQAHFDTTKAQLDANQADADLAAYHVQKARQDSERAWQMNQIQSAQRDLDEAHAKGVDPHHWFANKGTGSKIAMAIGLIAGGFNQGIHGGSNPMMDLMNKEIDRDIDAQKEGIAGKQRSLDNKVSLYGLMRQKGLDEDASRDAAKILAHQSLDAQLKAALPQATTAVGQLQLKQAIAENQANLAKFRGAFDEKAANKTATSTSEAFRPAQTVGGAPTPAQILKKAMELHEKNYGKPGNDWNQNVRAAARGLTGQDIMPGAAEPVITEPAKPGQAGRLAKPMMAAQANIAKLQELEKLANQSYLGAEGKARANQILADVKASGVTGLPDDIGRIDLGRLTGSVQAAINQARKGEQTTLGAAQAVMAGGGGGGGDEDYTPAGAEEE